MLKQIKNFYKPTKSLHQEITQNLKSIIEYLFLNQQSREYFLGQMYFTSDQDDYPINYTSPLSSQYLDLGSKYTLNSSVVQSTLSKSIEDDSYANLESQSDRLKKITKDKKKILMPQSSKQLSQLKRILKGQRQCFMKIEKPIFSPYFFLFSGHVVLEFIDNIEENWSFGQRPMIIQQLEKRDSVFTVKPSFSLISQEYDKAIYMLERRQNKLEYELAQLLKQYKLFIKNQEEKISKIKEAYQQDYDVLYELQSERGKYRNEIINNYIKENMKEDDFYLCHDTGINFVQNWTCPLFLMISKNLFALFGIEEDNVHHFMTKQDTFLQMVPSLSRKLLTYTTLKLQMDESETNNIFLNGFLINTLDNIQINCDINAYCYKIQYPLHLQYANIQQYDELDIERVQFIKFNITMNHLQYLLSQRCTNESLPTLEDIEYSVFSQIFIEKYYSQELKQLNKQVVEEECIPKEQEQQIVEVDQSGITCGFRYII